MALARKTVCTGFKYITQFASPSEKFLSVSGVTATDTYVAVYVNSNLSRSEERRVGKECRN